MSEPASSESIDSMLPDYERLNSFFRREVRCDYEAADLTQEVFLRLLRWRPHSKVTHSPSLLFRIARNLLIDRARRHQRKAGTCVPFEDVGTPIPSRESSPDQILELRERLDCIRQAIEGLSERCREVFILHRFGGLSYEEIAVRLGLSPSTVEKHMIRAIATCKAGVEQLDH